MGALFRLVRLEEVLWIHTRLRRIRLGCLIPGSGRRLASSGLFTRCRGCQYGAEQWRAQGRDQRKREIETHLRLANRDSCPGPCPGPGRLCGRRGHGHGRGHLAYRGCRIGCAVVVRRCHWHWRWQSLLQGICSWVVLLLLLRSGSRPSGLRASGLRSCLCAPSMYVYVYVHACIRLSPSVFPISLPLNCPSPLRAGGGGRPFMRPSHDTATMLESAVG